jgi:hypothetical protein
VVAAQDETARMAEELAAWKPGDGDLDLLWPLAKSSLETVTHLTEYEDEKANRILTAMSFQSALAGLVFAATVKAFSDTHVLTYHVIGPPELTYLLRFVLIASALGPFALYCFWLTRGAFNVLSAVTPRFNEPQSFRSSGGKPKSRLFYRRIVEVSPEDWAKAFSQQAISDVRADYIKNAVLESYLIAEKIADKLRQLDVGIRYMRNATTVLTWWLPFIGGGSVLLFSFGMR